MRTKTASLHLLTLALIAASMPLAGCEGLPGEKKTQGAVIGGASGAAAGAIIAGEDNRLLGAVIGTAIGAGAGYVVGNEISEKDKRDAQEAAAQKERTSSFTVADVQKASTADIDGDGNVTMAEIVAMQRAKLSDAEILRRVDATNVVFNLTEDQKATLRQEGVSNAVIDRLGTINRENVNPKK